MWNKLVHVEAEALVETMAYRLASVYLARNFLRRWLTRFTTLAYLVVEVESEISGLTVA